MTSTALGFANAAEWVVGTLLNRFKLPSTQSLATNAFYTTSVVTQGWDQLAVSASMSGAASGDMAASVFPVFPDGTVGTVALAPLQQTGPTFTSPNVQWTANYDVSGYDRVQVSVQNKNAGTQTLNQLNWRLS
jgi:hypothetical protein